MSKCERLNQLLNVTTQSDYCVLLILFVLGFPDPKRYGFPISISVQFNFSDKLQNIFEIQNWSNRA